jgi:hypothetical protein
MLKEWTLVRYQRKLQNINLEKDVHRVLHKDGKILFHKIPINPTTYNPGNYNDNAGSGSGRSGGCGSGGDNDGGGITYNGLLH